MRGESIAGAWMTTSALIVKIVRPLSSKTASQRRVRPLADRTFALAGIFQAARLVQQFSREGRADPLAFRAGVGSVLLIDAANVAAVYGGAGGLALGLGLVRGKLGG